MTYSIYLGWGSKMGPVLVGRFEQHRQALAYLYRHTDDMPAHTVPDFTGRVVACGRCKGHWMLMHVEAK